LTAVRFGLSPKIARAMNPAHAASSIILLWQSFRAVAAFVWVALGAAMKQY
jgi:hypothetical protein